MAQSYNGWQASRDPASIDVDKDFTAAGRKFPGGVKRGPVSVVLRYVIEQFDKRVEEVDLYAPGDEWGYFYKPSANSPNLLSCHSSGTAVDVNATRHPNGRRGTFTEEQVDTIHEILAEVDGVVRWLGDARTADEMHFEIKGTADEVARVAGRLLQPVPDEPIQEDDMPNPAVYVDANGTWMFWRGEGSDDLVGNLNGGPPVNLGGNITSGPTASGGNGLVLVAARGTDGAQWLLTFTASDWDGGNAVGTWNPVGGKS